MFLTDRRSFLLSTAGIITASFVATAQDWIEDAGEPFLLPPRAARETLWINHMGGRGVSCQYDTNRNEDVSKEQSG